MADSKVYRFIIYYEDSHDIYVIDDSQKFKIYKTLTSGEWIFSDHNVEYIKPPYLAFMTITGEDVVVFMDGITRWIMKEHKSE